MKTFKKAVRVIAMGAVIAIGLAACATTVPIKSVRMPTIDTSNIQRMAIKPFENKSGSSVGSQLAQYLTDRAQSQITTAGKFTVVAPTDPNAEGIFTGEVRNVTSKDTQNRSSYTDKEGNVIVTVSYTREVSVEFVYSVISTRTDMPIGVVSKQGSSSTSASESSSLTDTLTIAKKIVDSQLRTLTSDVVPTIVETQQTLMKETSKDKAVKQQMKMATDLVKNGHYQDAISLYDEIGSVAAKTNAGILRRAIESDAAATAQLAELFSDTSGVADKAIKNSLGVINAKLPAGSNIVIMKSNSTERNMLDYVVDQMTKTVVQEGKMKVVDRSNQALINAEQQYQLSGNVSDDSIVSIGNQLGVKYIVLCWISGEKSLRRLNVKLLNVETAQITDQSDFEI